MSISSSFLSCSNFLSNMNDLQQLMLVCVASRTADAHAEKQRTMTKEQSRAADAGEASKGGVARRA